MCTGVTLTLAAVADCSDHGILEDPPVNMNHIYWVCLSLFYSSTFLLVCWRAPCDLVSAAIVCACIHAGLTSPSISTSMYDLRVLG
jgi:hypothetical protein